MTMMSLDQVRKHKAADQAKAVKDVEARNAAIEEEPVPFITLRERLIKVLAGVGVAALFFTLVFCLFYLLLTPKTLSTHIVRLPKYDGKYGVLMNSNTVTSIRPLSPAYFQSGLKPGDKIVKVSGIDTTHGGYQRIDLLVSRTSDLFDIVLEVQRKVEATEPDFFYDQKRAPLFLASCAAALILLATLCEALSLKSGTTHAVTITRVDGGKLGISTRGAMICEVIPGGAAELQGCDLKAGDEIIAINGKRVVLSFYWTIWKMLEADVVELAIKRQE